MKTILRSGTFILYVSVVLLLFGIPESVNLAQGGKTLTVCASGCDFAKIQDAINAASASDTIQVQAGTYQENLTIKDKQDLALQGAGRDQVTLDGSLKAQEEETIPGIKIINGRNITVRGFKIINSRRGLEMDNSTGLTIADNSFEDNLRQGILLTNKSDAQIKSNVVQRTIRDIDGGRGQGIYVNGSQVVLTDNMIAENADCGLWVIHSGDQPSQASGANNTIQNNKGGDLCGNVPTTVLSEQPAEGTLDQVAVPSDVPTIQEALTRVKAGGTILVAPGTYRGRCSRVQCRSTRVSPSGGRDRIRQCCRHWGRSG